MNNRIKYLRELSGMKQSELATAIGIDQRTISRYENGISNPDMVILIALAEHFNVSLDYLVGRVDENYENKKVADTYHEILNKIKTLIKDV